MLISLHKQATTTPKIRAAIQASKEPALMVAERYGISEQTVWKWRKRDSVQDRSHTAHRLQTTLTPAQEAVAVALRKSLLLPLDDMLSVVREFLNPDVSRSGLDRCLRRHGAGIAVATDCNPGTSPLCSPLLAMNMACTLFRLTPAEALAGFTREAARALGLHDRGTLTPGLRADFALWRVAGPAELAYAIGLNRCMGVVRGGNRRPA